MQCIRIWYALCDPGEDTTSHTGAWTLFLVSQHPEVEAKIVAELDQVSRPDCQEPCTQTEN